MSIVLSHSTAWAIYHAPGRPAPTALAPERPCPLRNGYPTKREQERARRFLNDIGVPSSMLETIHAVVPTRGTRSRARGLSCHLLAHELPPHAIWRLTHGIYVVDPRLCFAQMATVFPDERELAEFGFELCGSYELPFDVHAPYRERAPLTSTDELRAFLESCSRMRGLDRARRALPSLRDRSRSPMETAHALLLTLPRSAGGLGLRSLVMDYRVDIPPTLRSLTRRHYVVCDACIPHARLDLEYNGFHHDEAVRSVADEERRSALEALGYRVRVLTKAAFFDPQAFLRYMNRIYRDLGKRARDITPTFLAKQEGLRRFVLRSWLGSPSAEAASTSPAEVRAS